MRTTVIRYTTHPQHADQNAALIAGVFQALERQRPTGLRYQALRGDDGVTFTHLVSVDDPEDHPLTGLPEFKAFVAGIRERCAQPPATVAGDVLGAYAGW